MSKKPVTKKTNAVNPTADSKVAKKNKNAVLLVIVAFTFIIYGNSIFNEYALDDLIVITKNDFVQKGISGIKDIMTTDLFKGYFKTEETPKLAGGRYRPLSLVTFAIEYQFLGLSPHFSHFINVLIFALCGIGIHLFTKKLFFNSQFKTLANSAIPLLTALLFIAHPIHTEVVANIKSRDELLTLLFSIYSTIFFLNYIDEDRKIKPIITGIILFFLALLSKETSITFLIIIPLTLFFFRKPEIKDYITIVLPITAISLLFIFIRSKLTVAGINMEVTNILNNPYFRASMMQKYATIIYTVGAYFMLLLFPINLSCDYDYNQIPIKTFGDLGVLISFCLILFLAVISIIQLKKRSIISYSIFFFVITFALVSNVIFPIGTIMTERFIFIPSFGFCLVMAYFINKFTAKTPSSKAGMEPLNLLLKNKNMMLIVWCILGLYSIKTIARNADWKDNRTLFGTDVKTCPNSANLNKYYGSTIVYEEKESPNKKLMIDSFNIAKPYLKKALELFPGYTECWSYLGTVYYMENNFDSAYYYQKQGLVNAPDDIDLNYNYGKTLDKLLKYDEAIKVLNHAVSLNPKHEGAYFNLALSYTNKGDADKGLFYFTKVIELNPKRADAYYYAGLISKAKGDSSKEKEYIDKAGALGYKTQ